MQIIHVAAMDNGHCIGKDNELLWHIKADLQHFKDITTGGVIVMGRRTFLSIGRPLPKRTTHVITKDIAWTAQGVSVWHSLETALEHAKEDAISQGRDAIYIVGGAQVYAQSLALADVLLLTHVDLELEGDAYYPDFTDQFTQVWRSDTQTDTPSGVGFYFARYERH